MANARLAHVGDPDSLRRVLAEIRAAYQGDPEAAHSLEDDTMRHVLRLTAEGHPQARQLATEMLTIADLDLKRWCA
ncbi:hypothetical protein [Nonomuraea basaltis]|uniref:hypothetical protein n=1 Tax=Nonomuraea basaltis TaxID=2495887 RepID=UPI00197D6608|nr:hypothetical protein [Nonomuraea basaltis]TMS00174.1 hypothetical protein EJK15_03625 [Nonomuraea basaltis]